MKIKLFAVIVTALLLTLMVAGCTSSRESEVRIVERTEHGIIITADDSSWFLGVDGEFYIDNNTIFLEGNISQIVNGSYIIFEYSDDTREPYLVLRVTEIQSPDEYVIIQEEERKEREKAEPILWGIIVFIFALLVIIFLFFTVTERRIKRTIKEEREREEKHR